MILKHHLDDPHRESLRHVATNGKDHGRECFPDMCGRRVAYEVNVKDVLKFQQAIHYRVSRRARKNDRDSDPLCPLSDCQIWGLPVVVMIPIYRLRFERMSGLLARKPAEFILLVFQKAPLRIPTKPREQL